MTKKILTFPGVDHEGRQTFRFSISCFTAGRSGKLRDFLPFPVKPRHASRLAQPNFGNLSKIITAATKEKY